MPVTHQKVLAQPDGADSSVVRPSDWNDDHVVSGLTSAELFRQHTASVAFGSGWLEDPTSGVVSAGSTFGLSNNSTDITIFPGAVLFKPPATNAERYFIFLPTETDITAQFAAPDPTDDRIDLVVVQILDPDTASAEIQVVTGTPDPAPVAPDLPANAIKLWEQMVPANDPELSNWPAAEDVRDMLNTGFNGGLVLNTTIFQERCHFPRGVTLEPVEDFFPSDLTILSINQERTVLQAAADPDGEQDYVRTFDAAGGGLKRGTRPIIDPTAIADPDLQAVVVMLIALGLVIDGTP